MVLLLEVLTYDRAPPNTLPYHYRPVFPPVRSEEDPALQLAVEALRGQLSIHPERDRGVTPGPDGPEIPNKFRPGSP